MLLSYIEYLLRFLVNNTGPQVDCLFIIACTSVAFVTLAQEYSSRRFASSKQIDKVHGQTGN